jgi:hypothetical protein
MSSVIARAKVAREGPVMTRGSTSTLVDRFAHWAVVSSLTLACESLVTIDAIVRPSSVQFTPEKLQRIMS